MHKLIRTPLVTALAVAAFSLGLTAIAADSDSGATMHGATGLKGTVSIEQVSPSSVGSWMFIMKDEAPVSSTDKGANAKNYSFGFTNFGPVTLSLQPPPGMTTVINVYRGGNKFTTQETRQLTVTLYPGDTYRFVVQYSLTNVGSLGITSTPSNVPLRITGPDKKRYSSRSPHTFTNLPAGRYTIQAGLIPGYINPPLYTKDVEAGKRITLNIEMPKDTTKTKGGSSSNVQARQSTKRDIRSAAEIREAQRAQNLINGVTSSSSSNSSSSSSSSARY